MTSGAIYYLTMADLHAIADEVVGDPVVRDPGLIESATARPRIDFDRWVTCHPTASVASRVCSAREGQPLGYRLVPPRT